MEKKDTLSTGKTVRELELILHEVKLLAIARAAIDSGDYFANSIASLLKKQLEPAENSEIEPTIVSNLEGHAKTAVERPSSKVLLSMDDKGEALKLAVWNIIFYRRQIEKQQKAIQVVLDRALANIDDESNLSADMEIFCELIIQKFPPLIGE